MRKSLRRRRLLPALITVLTVALLLGHGAVDYTVAVFSADESAVRTVPVSGRMIALTFDDGPSPDWTPAMLDILKAYGAKATFFVVGTEVARYPEIVRRAVLEGHEIATHTYTHPKVTTISRDKLKSELERSSDVIFQTTGTRPTCYRPPYGALSVSTIQLVHECGYNFIMWTRELDSRDWERPGPTKIVSRVIDNARPGGIVLMHDGGGDRHQSVAALPDVLKRLSAEGYQFLTVSELLKASTNGNGGQ